MPIGSFGDELEMNEQAIRCAEFLQQLTGIVAVIQHAGLPHNAG